MSARTIVASIRIASEIPTPNIFMMLTPPKAKAANDTARTSAAAVMMRPER